MAKQTDKDLRKMLIYSLFVRNFSEEGTFKGVIPQLQRLKDLGTDMIWFLPMYPIGEKNRKGVDGSPYAIQDYRQVDPNYGTMEEFDELVQAIHDHHMKVMIDIVFNHTSPDSVLSQEHPEWFYHREDGSFGNRVGDWTDIIDLDYGQRDLWDYQIDTLTFWASKVDGFRCDVAPLVPIEFWLEARQAVERVNPDLVWLSESVHPGFIRHLRGRGLTAHSDSEIYQAFDMTYDYDIRDEFEAYLSGDISLNQFVYRLNLQEVIFPDNYIKLRNIENHDNPRAFQIIANEPDLLQWTAFTFFQKGSTLIYNGQEVMAKHEPSLFEKDLIDWQAGKDISEYISNLAKIQKKLPMDATYELVANEETQTVIGKYSDEEKLLSLGLFNLKESSGTVAIDLEDGSYQNLINQKIIEVKQGRISIDQGPIILILK